ncbi:MAG: hypothetical protein PHQ95_01100 [Candidatus Gracilibacteria bacterium]|nr:hypothetical protein [Candidatus Gracilibacteria bacterium]
MKTNLSSSRAKHPIEDIFAHCFAKGNSKEERLYLALLRDPYESGEIDGHNVIELCELIKKITIAGQTDEQREITKREFLHTLNHPTNILDKQKESIVSEVTKEVQIQIEDTLSEKQSPFIIDRAMINKAHFDASNFLKGDKNKSILSESERKFLSQISEWKLLGVLGEGEAGERTFKIIQEKVGDHAGKSPEQNIADIKNNFGINSTSFCRIAKKKKMKLDFRSFSLDAMRVLHHDAKQFIYIMSRKGVMKKGFDSNMITPEQNTMLEKIFLSKGKESLSK